MMIIAATKYLKGLERKKKRGEEILHSHLINTPDNHCGDKVLKGKIRGGGGNTGK